MGLLFPFHRAAGAVFLCWYLWLSPAAHASDSSGGMVLKGCADPSRTVARYQASFGYWNDNFIVPELLGEEAEVSRDDYVTASFWVQAAREKSGEWWFVDLYHSILTNRKANYRTDLMTVRLSLEKDTAIGPLRLGSGIIADSNFGGRTIQNAYHSLTGIKRVRLPYINEHIAGIVLFMRYKPMLWDSEHVQLRSYLENSYRSVVGPSSFKAGMEFDAKAYPSGIVPVVHLQALAGYLRYYGEGKYLSPLFKEGFSWGLLLSGGSVEKRCVAFWVIRNQYGMDQIHFGVSFTAGWNGTRMSDLNDVLFP